MKKFPWLSLILLFAAYSTFSWFLINITTTRWVWILVLSFAVIQALLLTTWFDGLRRFIRSWLRSDLGYFTLIIIFSMGLIMALVWFKTFGYFLVLVSAELLARLDLQHAGFNRVQSLFILTLISLAGLATGLTVSYNSTLKLVT